MAEKKTAEVEENEKETKSKGEEEIANHEEKLVRTDVSV